MAKVTGDRCDFCGNFYLTKPPTWISISDGVVYLKGAEIEFLNKDFCSHECFRNLCNTEADKVESFRFASDNG